MKTKASLPRAPAAVLVPAPLVAAVVVVQVVAVAVAAEPELLVRPLQQQQRQLVVVVVVAVPLALPPSAEPVAVRVPAELHSMLPVLDQDHVALRSEPCFVFVFVVVLMS